MGVAVFRNLEGNFGEWSRSLNGQSSRYARLRNHAFVNAVRIRFDRHPRDRSKCQALPAKERPFVGLQEFNPVANVPPEIKSPACRQYASPWPSQRAPKANSAAKCLAPRPSTSREGLWNGFDPPPSPLRSRGQSRGSV